VSYMMMCSFGSSFKYLGHTISSTNADDADIQREITNMFVRTNILLRAQIMLKLCCSKPIAYVCMMLPCGKPIIWVDATV